MLIRFNVRNFLSFNQNDLGNSEEFSMIPGKVRNKTARVFDDGNIKLLKFAAIFGANASGKSNLVKAMSFMKYTLLFGLPQNCEEMFCKTSPANKDKVTYFNIELRLNNKYFAYGFEAILNQKKITSEWLMELTPDNKEKIIFTRDVESGNYEFGNIIKKSKMADRLNIYIDDIKTDSKILFLNVMNHNKDNIYVTDDKLNIMRDVYNWISNDLEIDDPLTPVSKYEFITNYENINKVCNILHAFGTGIDSYKLEEVNPNEVFSLLPTDTVNEIMSNVRANMNFLKQHKEIGALGLTIRVQKDFYIFQFTKDEKVRCCTIKFKHDNTNFLFHLSEESDGTVRLIDLLDILLLGNGKTYVIDELDRCLHPSLTYKFVETFLELAEQNNTQLIVTTHESRLLDFDLLRRDEIWFVNKKIDGESNIYSLEEYNERFDKKIDKAYLEGRYDGVPIFTTIFPMHED